MTISTNIGISTMNIIKKIKIVQHGLVVLYKDNYFLIDTLEVLWSNGHALYRLVGTDGQHIDTKQFNLSGSKCIYRMVKNNNIEGLLLNISAKWGSAYVFNVNDPIPT